MKIKIEKMRKKAKDYKFNIGTVLYHKDDIGRRKVVIGYITEKTEKNYILDRITLGNHYIEQTYETKNFLIKSGKFKEEDKWGEIKD